MWMVQPSLCIRVWQGGQSSTPLDRFGGSGVPVPPVDVVGLRVGQVEAAAGAAAVAFGQGDPLAGGEQAGGPAEVQGEAVPAQDGGDDAGGGGQLPDRAGGDRLGQPVDGAVPDPVHQGVQAGAHHQGGRGCGRYPVAAQHVGGDHRQGVGLQLRDGAGVLEQRSIRIDRQGRTEASVGALSRRARRVWVTIASIAAFTGPADSGSRWADRCSIP